MPLRNQYVAQRTLARMKSRGEAMVLRRISMLAGPEPFKNPPDTENLAVVAANVVLGQTYLNIAGSVAIGRLIPGDQVICHGTFDTVWTVVAMPATVLTDSDGIAEVDGAGAPIFGIPAIYNADTLAANNQFPVVAVSGTGTVPGPGQPVTLVFAADATVYGNALSYQQAVALGWVEVDTLNLGLAAHNVDPPPKVNDLLILTSSGGEKRAILQTGRRFSNGVNFLFPVQAR